MRVTSQRLTSSVDTAVLNAADRSPGAEDTNVALLQCLHSQQDVKQHEHGCLGTLINTMLTAQLDTAKPLDCRLPCNKPLKSL